MKKGDLAWDEIGKMILALVLLLFLIFAIWLLKDKLYDIFNNMKNALGL